MSENEYVQKNMTCSLPVRGIIIWGVVWRGENGLENIEYAFHCVRYHVTNGCLMMMRDRVTGPR